MSFGETMKNIREQKKLTQKELGEKLGIAQQTVAQYEGQQSCPKLATVQKIAAALEVDSSDLIRNELTTLFKLFNLAEDEGDSVTIGETIREIRKEKGLTQKELSEKLGTVPQNVIQWEKGRRNPKFETIKKIADVLETDVSCLFGSSLPDGSEIAKTGYLLKTLREKYGLTQKKLADACGISVGAIQQYEIGRRQPRTEALLKILKVFDLTVEEFYGIQDRAEGERTEYIREIEPLLTQAGYHMDTAIPRNGDNIVIIKKDHTEIEITLSELIKIYYFVCDGIRPAMVRMMDKIIQNKWRCSM